MTLDGFTPWPSEFAARYRQLGYWGTDTLAELPRRWAEIFGAATALVHYGTGVRMDYAELDRRVDRMAAGFREHGIAAGDRVVVQLPNHPEFVVTVFALIRRGAIPVFALLAHRGNEIRHLCRSVDATGFVTPAHYRGFDHRELAVDALKNCPTLRTVFVAGEADDGVESAVSDRFVALAEVDAAPAAFPAPHPSEVAFFLLSGGTTAMPKLIGRTHYDYCYQTRVLADLVQLTAGDVYLAALPVEFNFTWGSPGVVGTLCRGGTVVLVDDPNPDDCFAAIDREQVTVTSLVPAMAQLWMEIAELQPPRLSTLRLLQIGGAPLQRSVAERVSPTLGCALQQVFGMAEGLLSVTRLDDPVETVLGTQGRPISPGDEIRLVDDADADVPLGHTGELLTRGPYTLRGYFQAPEHNQNAFTPDGFFRTGDLARLSAAGNLVIEGRRKDIVIRGGNKISATELEGYLLAHPAVSRVVVVPVPDADLGEAICVCVQPIAEPPTLAELRELLQRSGVAEYKWPDRLAIVTALPLTGLGKVDKAALVRAVLAVGR
ncbi:(2,3-dihydroxybenzoyl)adenylate synthase [Nocardia brasiliensis]|uniref:(2,3-dihydroxybenzoyl)adenylate synthase n=1 Tax=Nocardia brasiliensis TaxID=37326 RepID=UPI003D91E48D